MKRKLFCVALIVSFLGGISVKIWHDEGTTPVVYASEPEAPREIKIEVKIDWTEERIIKEIRDTFPEEPGTMVLIARCESSLKPTAVGPTQDYGIFQLHGPSHDLSGIDPFDPGQNIAFAKGLYDQQGKQPWKSSRHCWDK